MDLQRSDPVKIAIRRITVERIIDLRHAMLRQGLPREAAVFAGDEADTAIHLSAFAGETVVGCLTLHLNEWQGEPAWQLRGMACRGDWQKRGVGRRLVEEAERLVLAGVGPRLMWCNARVPAIGFYCKMGWDVVSEEFEIPTAGPHVKMSRRLLPV
ncbi:MAG TPA: GNAT family N-acetyltransferase [Tepidisphaeraceae bacterium]|jgi:GNAT superfamily N-acetyltransferase|nr:GNAT family N-acetyltransferase [Tepidisphaeraceae bacterium]